MEVFETLIEKNITITTAESLTGGLFSNELTNTPGISKIFSGGFITYSNEMKINILDVDENIIKQQGAISKEVSLQMAQGAKYITGADLSVSFTGNAGPAILEDKDIGKVFISIIYLEQEKTYNLNLRGTRLEIKQECIKIAKEKIKEIIK